MVMIFSREKLSEAKTLLSLEADDYHTALGAASVPSVAVRASRHFLRPFLMTAVPKTSTSE